MSSVPFERQALSLLLLIPLIGLLALAGARLWKDRGAPHLWKVAAIAGAAQLALALSVHARFDVATTRHTGTRGFQFVERAVLFGGAGIEYGLGVDGLSVGLITFASFALLAVAMLGSERKTAAARHWALVLLANLGVIGALVAIDLALMLAFWGLALLALLLVVHGSATTGARSIALRFAASSLIAYALVVAGCLLVASHAGPARLIDGTSAAWAFSIPELVYADLVGPGHTLARMPVIKPIYAALFLGLGSLMGLAPLHAWPAGTTARVSAETALLISVAAGTVASYVFLRLGYTVLPSGTAWAGPFLSGMGALSVVWGAFAGAAHDDLKRVASSMTAVNAGVAVFAIGSLTAIGVEGAVAAIQSRILASVVVLGLASQLEARFGSADVRRGRAFWAAAPLVALIAAIAGTSQLGAPGSYVFVGRLLSIIGAVPLRPIAAVGVVLGLLVVAISQARLVHTALAARRKGSPQAGAHAAQGDFAPPARAVLALAALAVVLLGFWPKPALSAVSASALEQASRANRRGPLEIVDRPGKRSHYALARALPSLNRRVTERTGLSAGRRRPLLATCVQAKP
jgi:NADH:ubiquinone oxidoreductase subunit 4 (subunit M)